MQFALYRKYAAYDDTVKKYERALKRWTVISLALAYQTQQQNLI